MTTSDGIEQVVIGALGASAEVTALIADRLYLLDMPQGPLPALVCQRVEISPDNTLQGFVSESVLFVLNSFGQTYEEAKEVAVLR